MTARRFLYVALTVCSGTAVSIHAQSLRRAFEAASVKPASTGCRGSDSTGRMLQCNTVAGYIQIAYNLSAYGPTKRPGRRLEIVGGPDWIRSDIYEVKAEVPDGAPPDQLHGSMMQALLEERFKLRIHQDAKEAPVYFLTLAKGIPKIKTLGKNGCVPRDYNATNVTDGVNYCGAWTVSVRPNSAGGRNLSVDSRGETLAEFATDLSNMGSDRVVVDRTGIAGCSTCIWSLRKRHSRTARRLKIHLRIRRAHHCLRRFRNSSV